jgi:hypothetical protein
MSVYVSLGVPGRRVPDVNPQRYFHCMFVHRDGGETTVGPVRRCMSCIDFIFISKLRTRARHSAALDQRMSGCFGQCRARFSLWEVASGPSGNFSQGRFLGKKWSSRSMPSTSPILCTFPHILVYNGQKLEQEPR